MWNMLNIEWEIKEGIKISFQNPLRSNIKFMSRDHFFFSIKTYNFVHDVF